MWQTAPQQKAFYLVSFTNAIYINYASFCATYILPYIYYCVTQLFCFKILWFCMQCLNGFCWLLIFFKNWSGVQNMYNPLPHCLVSMHPSIHPCNMLVKDFIVALPVAERTMLVVWILLNLIFWDVMSQVRTSGI